MTREELDNNSNVDLSKLPANKKRALDTRNNRGNGSGNNKGSIAYMSKSNVKEFNRAMEKKIYNSSGIGRPYAFDSVEGLEKEMSDFFELCKVTDTVPTITSLALWLGCNRDTIYAHINNSNSPFSGIFKKTLTYLQAVMENGTLSGDINPVTYIFLSKNYFGMRDDKNIQISAQQGSNVNTTETADALRKQIEEENVPNATLVEEE